MSSKKKGCCEWICTCFSSNKNDSNNIYENNNNALQKRNVVIINSNRLEQPNNESNRNNINNIQNNSILNANYRHNLIDNPNHINNIGEDNDEEFKSKIIKITKKFKINSKVDKMLIASSDIPLIETNNRYNCPICFKYFNNILSLSCCKNYICLFCSEDYLTSHIKYEMNIKCPFCGSDEKTIVLDDAGTEAPLKFYSDSPSTLLKLNQTKNKKKSSALSDINLNAEEKDQIYYKDTKLIDEDNIEEKKSYNSRIILIGMKETINNNELDKIDDKQINQISDFEANNRLNQLKVD